MCKIHHFLSLSIPQLPHSFLLEMENWVKRVNCRMDHEPMHTPISQKIYWQHDVSIRDFKYTQIMQNFRADGALVNWRSQSPILTVVHGSASSLVTPAPPAFVGAPVENHKAYVLLDLALICILRTAVAPFERVKLLMQNQNEMIKSGRLPQPYTGMFDCFARTIRNEGISSLWRGNTAIAIGYVSAKAVSSILFGYVNTLEHSQWNYVQIQATSGLVAAANLFLVYPCFYAGTRMANDVKTTSYLGRRQFNGIVDVYRKTLKSDGIAGLYRGYTISLAEIGMTTTVSAALKPWQQFWLLHLQNNNLAMATVAFGFQICRNLASYPLDTVNRRMMMTSGEAVKYKSSLNAFAQIFKMEGVKSFYKGAGAEILLNSAFNGYALLLVHLAGVLIDAMKKPCADSQPAFTFTIRWKNAGDK